RQVESVREDERKPVQGGCHWARKKKADLSFRITGADSEDSADDHRQTRADPESGREGKVPEKNQREGEAPKRHGIFHEPPDDGRKLRLSRPHHVPGSVDVLFLSTFENMGLNRSTLRPTCQPLFTFNSTKVSPLGIVTLKVCAMERFLDVDFVVIDCQSSFSIIMGRGCIHTMHR
ncbi:hypothetical protein PanWU01x14_015200, partial [Parasponia andersonii]